jgi:CubicO group peptidase (beta-lactamase class C family)
MKRVVSLITPIFLITLLGCNHTRPNAAIRTPITFPIKTIESNNAIVDQSFPNDKLDRLEKTLNDIMAKTQAKGLSAAVGIPGKGLWCGTRGTTGNKAIEKITPDLMFCAGSISKIFTAVVVLSLEDEGRLDLEDTVDQWLPEVHQAEHITINHLLTHTSGIPNFDSVKEYKAHPFQSRNPKEVFSYLKDKKLLFEAGQHYAYSNMGYVMLGIIIEKVTQKSYEEAVKQYIINKIDLKETQVMSDQALKELIVRGHHHGKVLTETENYTHIPGAGSIMASPRDLIRFLQELLSGKLLSRHLLRIMFSDMNLMTETQPTYYGKGIVAAINTPIGDMIGHSGGINGFAAALYCQYEEMLFVCVMMNDDIKSPDPAVFRLMEVMMDL